MNPYSEVKSATQGGESLLALCCGIGLELMFLNTKDVTAVDIVPEYLAEVHERCPQAKLVESDALKYLERQKSNSVDVISLIDAIEHMSKTTGLKVIKEAKRVARQKILLFTPDGFVANHPHDAWGIPAKTGDKYQVHKSGWTETYLTGLGFELMTKQSNISQHDDPYVSLMMQHICSQ